MKSKTLSLYRSNLFAYLVFASFGLTFTLYFTFQGLGNDFRTFFDAGKAAQDIANPWSVNQGSQYSAYLNGPLTSLLLSIIAYLPYDLALLLVRITTIALVPLAFQALAGLVGLKMDQRSLYLSSSVLLFTFPIRSNLEYGQLAIIFTCAFILALNQASRRTQPKSMLTLGFTAFFCLDYKPHVFLPIFVLLYFRWRLLLVGFSIGFVISGAYSWILTREMPFRFWIEAVIQRATGSSHSSEQMSIFSILGVKSSISWFVALTFSILVVVVAKKKLNLHKIELILISFFIWQALIPFSHPTDLFLVVMAGTYLVLQNSNRFTSRFGPLILGLSAVWSNNVLIAFLSTVLILIVVFWQLRDEMKDKKYSIYLILGMFTPQIAFYFLLFDGVQWEGIARQTINWLAVVGSSYLFLSFKRRELI